MDLTVESTISHTEGMKLIYTDGSGLKSMGTFKAIDFVEDMQQKCRIGKSNGTEILVYPEILHFVQNPGIVFIPQTSGNYCRDCRNISLLWISKKY